MNYTNYNANNQRNKYNYFNNKKTTQNYILFTFKL